ncbi:hypothetical protein PAT3040_00975 [Paenibacillus agaridevorans]|uniref:SLH domain-containing protein n=1 Tax=Paenibacillus agaridevorans TaxID=171404 RepID=A0A2R5EN82_9BACL|nr:S-layer homology domain-containing protein [Paenibacillus agaridevorans]GBG06448.1 hypothetical protein PAT3040_00975 [Paenibacillus agaridevorans]
MEERRRGSRRALSACLLAVIVLLASVSVQPAAAKEEQLPSIAVGQAPHAVAVNPATNRVYVANAAGDSVTVLADEASGSPAVVATIGVGKTPYALAVDAKSNRIYVANADSGTVTVINGDTHAVQTVKVGDEPVALAVNSTGNKAYVANAGSGSITEIDGATLTTRTFAAGESPIAVAINEAAGKVYAVNIDSDTATIIDGATGFTETVTTGNGPNALAVHIGTGNVYAANFYSGDVTIIDGTTGKTRQVEVGKGPAAIAIDQTDGKVYVANSQDNSVSVLSVSGEVLGTVPVGKRPGSLAVHQGTGNVYVANYESDSITAIDGHTYAATETAIGAGPIALALHAGLGKGYVAQYRGNSIGVLDGLGIVKPPGGGEGPVITPSPSPPVDEQEGAGENEGEARWPEEEAGSIKLGRDSATISVQDNGHIKAILNSEALEEAFTKLAEQGQAAVQRVTFTLEEQAHRYRIGIPAKCLQSAALAAPDAVLKIKAGTASYYLPVSLPPLVNALSKRVEHLEDVVVYVGIDTSRGLAAEELAGKAGGQGLQLISSPLTFSIAIEDDEITDYGAVYVARSIWLPEKLKPTDAIALRVSPSGEFHYLPVRFSEAAAGGTLATLLQPGNGIIVIAKAPTPRQFQDLAGHWVSQAVEELAARQIVKGVSETTFSPSRAVSRAEFTSLAIRALALAEQASAGTAFGDVAPDSWYAAAVGAAVQAGLTQGTAGGLFDPEGRLTREQLAVFSVRMLALASHPAKVAANRQEELLGAFADGAEVSNWARGAAAAVMQAGIMEGMGDGRFAPKKNVTRAEAAAVVKRLLVLIGFIQF